MMAGRQRWRATLAPANMRGVRLLYRALKRGESVGLLPDQAPGSGDGVWAEFFGRPAYTMMLAQRLQNATGAAAAGRGFRLHLMPLPPEQLEATALNAAVEQLVRRCPAQYLWSYNRYKVPAGAAVPRMKAEG
jgi:KDO2-lipid IV(A) lauroyltransferase